VHAETKLKFKFSSVLENCRKINHSERGSINLSNGHSVQEWFHFHFFDSVLLDKKWLLLPPCRSSPKSETSNRWCVVREVFRAHQILVRICMGRAARAFCESLHFVARSGSSSFVRMWTNDSLYFSAKAHYRKSGRLAMRIWCCPHKSILMNRVEGHCYDIGQHRNAVGNARKVRESEKTRNCDGVNRTLSKEWTTCNENLVLSPQVVIDELSGMTLLRYWTTLNCCDECSKIEGKRENETLRWRQKKKITERVSYHFFVPSIVAYLLSQLWCSKHHLLFRSCIFLALQNPR